MIDIKPYIEGLRLGLFKHHINNNDFWATEIKLKCVSANYPFHFNMINLTESPCNMLIKTAHQFANTFWAQDGNILDARICFSDLLKVNRTKKLTLRHFRDKLPIVNQEKILSLCLKHLINLATRLMASWENLNNVCGFELILLVTTVGDNTCSRPSAKLPTWESNMTIPTPGTPLGVWQS